MENRVNIIQESLERKKRCKKMEIRVNQTQERKSKKAKRKMEKRANEAQEQSLEEREKMLQE